MFLTIAVLVSWALRRSDDGVSDAREVKSTATQFLPFFDSTVSLGLSFK